MSDVLVFDAEHDEPRPKAVSRRDALRRAASVVDVSGSTARQVARAMPVQSTREALERDLRVMGKDLARALGQVTRKA